jgi:GT2 family glycosyltransferase
MAQPFVKIIMLNYQNWQDTKACIESVLCSTYTHFEIVIIDNASPNDAVPCLQAAFPTIPILETDRNLGFTGGVNFGIRSVLLQNPEYILVLNPDTLVHPDFLKHLVEALENNEDAAIACSTIYHHPDTKSVWYAGGSFIAWRGLAVHNTSAPKAGSSVQDVTFVTGCVTLLRTSALETIGLQDERFFMYLDDIEYSARIRQKGYRLLYVPDSVIYHRSEYRETNPFKLYYSVRNRLLLINARVSGIQRIIAASLFITIILGKSLIWFFTNRRFYLAVRKGLSDYFHGVFNEGRGTHLFSAYESTN